MACHAVMVEKREHLSFVLLDSLARAVPRFRHALERGHVLQELIGGAFVLAG